MTDGLRAEREQGITIDVAYRYFATPRRSFIIADTPGHVRYTRNMVTGASTADLAVVLIDARNGVVEQSRRHACLSALLGLRHVVFAVNKMDLVDWDEDRFREIERDALDLAERLEVPDARVVPISALEGDNVVERVRARAVLRRPAAAGAARDRRGRARPQPRRRPAADPVGRAPARRRSRASTGSTPARSPPACCAPATRSPRCPRARARGSSRSRPPTARSRRRSRRCRCWSGSPTTSTSAAATCSPRPPSAPPVARELEATICWMADAPLRPGAKLRLQAHHAAPSARRSRRCSRAIDVATPRRGARARRARRSTTSAGSGCSPPRPVMADPYDAQPHHRRVRARRRADPRHGRRRDDPQRGRGHGRGDGRRAGLGGAAAAARRALGARSARAARPCGCAARPSCWPTAAAAVGARAGRGRPRRLPDRRRALPAGPRPRPAGAAVRRQRRGRRGRAARRRRPRCAARRASCTPPPACSSSTCDVPDGEAPERTAERVLEALG